LFARQNDAGYAGLGRHQHGLKIHHLFKQKSRGRSATLLLVVFSGSATVFAQKNVVKHEKSIGFSAFYEGFVTKVNN
jgi:hypothetical protein